MPRQFGLFTQRHLGREKLFNPEVSDWPVDDQDHGANWDYLVTICVAFGVVVLAITVGILVWAIGIF